jgi:hypothetical protein
MKRGKVNAAEAAAIARIDDAYMRKIFQLRYMRGMTWAKIALTIGGGNTADGVRIAHSRFLKKRV